MGISVKNSGEDIAVIGNGFGAIAIAAFIISNAYLHLGLSYWWTLLLAIL